MTILRTTALMMFIAMMSVSCNVSAEYFAKVFIDGFSISNSNGGSDGDDTEQNGGEDGELTFTVSRTTGYNHTPFYFTLTSNSYECFTLSNEYYGEYTDCGVSTPLTENLWMDDAPPGVYTFTVTAEDEMYGTALKTYSFSITILPINDDEGSDDDLSFGYYKKIITQGENFTLSISSSTFECHRVELLNDGYGTVTSGCGVTYPTSMVIYAGEDFNELTGTLNFVVTGYNLNDDWEEEDNKSYPFSVTVNPSTAAEKPVLNSFGLEGGEPRFYHTFNSPFYGDSYYYHNNVIINASKTREYKLDVPSIGFTTGWQTTTYDDSSNEIPVSIPIPYSDAYDVTVTLRNEEETVSNTRQLHMLPSLIEEPSIKLCAMDASHCSNYGNSMAIWAGGEGDYGSLTFSANNTDCITIQSSDDPDYSIPIQRCFGMSGGRNATFNLFFPNHDPVGRTSKNYTYNFTSVNYITGEEGTRSFTVTIEYD